MNRKIGPSVETEETLRPPQDSHFENAFNIVMAEISDTKELYYGDEPVGRNLVWHSVRVAQHAEESAKQDGFNDELTDAILVGALAHDVGKTVLARNRPQLLSEQHIFDDVERQIMAAHTDIGYELLTSFVSNPYLRFARVSAALHHNFKPGSSPYKQVPNVVKEDIRIAAKEFATTETEIVRAVLLIAVCDVDDAIHRRKYVDQELRLHQGKQFIRWARDFITVDGSHGLHEGDLSRTAHWVGAARDKQPWPELKH